MINLKTKYWEIENIDTILFDKDGTFIDLHYFWGKMTELRVLELINIYNLDKNLLKELCLLLGYDTDSQKMKEDGITALYSRSKIIEIFKNDLLKYSISITTEKLEEIFDNVNQIFYKDMEKYTKPIPEAIDFIEKMHKKNIKMAIVTSDSIESTLKTLKQFNWEKYFKAIIGRESTPDLKETGTAAKMALKELNSNPRTSIMIGDTPIDFMCAKNAGIEKTILVSTGQIGLNNLEKITPYALKSLKEIEYSEECLKI